MILRKSSSPIFFVAETGTHSAKLWSPLYCSISGSSTPLSCSRSTLVSTNTTAAGGNAIRAGTDSLDRAQALGLTVLADLPFGKQRAGFRYDDQAAVERQREQVRRIVLKFKDHPALLAWAIGNEFEIGTTAEQRGVLWTEMNQVARMIHRIDPNHPVITPVGGAYKRMLGELNRYCPDLDAVGLNSYADMLTLPEDFAKQGWTRPYWVTEFGPRGHWQVEKTAWNLPIEDNSSQKADFYRRAYEHAVQGQPNCLGSFVFHWDQHHEKTHTWYGMFLEDGSRTESVDVMTFLWSGKWPANRAPRVGPAAIARGGAQGPAVVAPGSVVDFRFDVSIPQSDALRISWDLRGDVSGNPNVGGDREEPTPPICICAGRPRGCCDRELTASGQGVHVPTGATGEFRRTLRHGNPAHYVAAGGELAGTAKPCAHSVLRPVDHQAGVVAAGGARPSHALSLR